MRIVLTVVLERQHLPAVEPGQRQQPMRGEFRPHLRHADAWLLGENVPIKRNVFGFALIVELFAQPRTDFLADFACVDGGIHTAPDCEQPFELTQIRFHRRLHVRILQLAGQRGAVMRDGAMHLSERRRRRRLVLET